MPFCSRVRRASSLLLLAVVCSISIAPAQQTLPRGKFPFPEKLSYQIEWHSIVAGDLTLQLTQAGAEIWQTNLQIQSAGMVTRLFKVLDTYRVTSDSQFCGSNSMLDAQEGKRHRITQLTFENTRKKVKYEEHDLIKNTQTNRELDIPPCAHEVAGALASLRLNDIQPGKSIVVPVTDGKKLANAKIEGQAKETLTISGKTYNTIRYEAFLFDNVLYSRKGRLFIWLSDDAERTPVQFRIQLGFPVGTILLQLDKQEKL